MKKWIVLIIVGLLLSGCDTFTEDAAKSALNLDKDGGDTVTAADFDAIDTAVTDNDSRLDTIEALTGPVFSDGDGTFTDMSAISSTELGYLNGVTSSVQTQITANLDNIADILDGTDAMTTPVLGTPTSGDGQNLTNLDGENVQDDTIDEDSIDFGTGTDQVSATDIPTDVSGFDNNLSSSETTVQAALDVIDEMTTALATQLSQDDSSIVVDDDGVDPGTTTITQDGAVVAVFAAAGNSLGPISINKALSANNTYSSIEVLSGINGGEAISQWDLVYYDTTQTEWMIADADASGEAPAWGMSVTATSNGSAGYVMTRGFVRYDTWNWTPGAKLYLDDGTPGGLTETAPSTSTDIVQPVGIAVTADIVYFNFDPVNGYYTVE